MAAQGSVRPPSKGQTRVRFPSMVDDPAQGFVRRVGCLSPACGDSDHSAAAQKVQGENKRLLVPASAGEQYHAEGLYKDRSAFICRRSSTGRALMREGIEHLNALDVGSNPTGGTNSPWTPRPGGWT